MTPKQKQRAVDKATKKLREAADAMLDLQLMANEYGIDMEAEGRFASDLRERANYWENCTWWKK